MTIETRARPSPISPRRASGRRPRRTRNGSRDRARRSSRPREYSRILHLACDD